MNIAILTADIYGSATKSIINAGEKRGHTMSILNPADLYIYISEKESGFDKVYNGKNHFVEPERVKAREIDAIIPRIGANLEYGCTCLEHFTRNLDIYATQNADGLKATANKLVSLQRFSQAKLKVPTTVMCDRAPHVKWLLKMVGGLPAIAKSLYGSQGKAVYILNEPLQTNTFLRNFYDKKEKLLIQQFIDGGSKDIRCIVINGKVVVAMERTAKKGELRANISQGGSGRKVELSKEDQEIAIKGARSCGLEVAGVDLMKDPDGNTYVIESNGNYGYHIEEITGVDISTPLIEMCEQNYKKKGKGSETVVKAEDINPNNPPLPMRDPNAPVNTNPVGTPKRLYPGKEEEEPEEEPEEEASAEEAKKFMDSYKQQKRIGLFR